MHKNIKTIYNNALESYTYSDIDGENNKGTQLNIEKFAELIIKDCISCGEILIKNYQEQNLIDSINDYQMLIKRHFGIDQ